MNLTWLQKHERLILGIALLLISLFLLNKFLNKSYDTSVARNQAAQQVLKDQVAKNADLQKQQDAREQQYQAMLETLTRQNQSLVAAVAARNQVVVGQQKVDAGLGLPELAARQQTLVGTSGISSTENGLLESPAAAVAVTQSLELLPVLKQDNQDLQTLVDNKDKQITSINTVVTGFNDQVNGLRLQLTDSSKACDARVAVARKSRWKWFKIGVVAGFLGGAYVGHKIP